MIWGTYCTYWHDTLAMMRSSAARGCWDCFYLLRYPRTLVSESQNSQKSFLSCASVGSSTCRERCCSLFASFCGRIIWPPRRLVWVERSTLRCGHLICTWKVRHWWPVSCPLTLGHVASNSAEWESSWIWHSMSAQSRCSSRHMAETHRALVNALYCDCFVVVDVWGLRAARATPVLRVTMLFRMKKDMPYSAANCLWIVFLPAGIIFSLTFCRLPGIN